MNALNVPRPAPSEPREPPRARVPPMESIHPSTWVRPPHRATGAAVLTCLHTQPATYAQLAFPQARGLFPPTP